jgi:hypothetical protein
MKCAHPAFALAIGLALACDSTSPVSSNTWATRASMPTPLVGVGIATVGDTLHAIGGADSLGANWSTGQTDGYSRRSNRWRATAPLPTPRVAVGVGVLDGSLVPWGPGC